MKRKQSRGGPLLENQSSDFVEIRGFSDLTRGVTLEAEQGLVRAHALAVVFNPHVGFPTVAKLDFDPRGSRIDAVFH